MKLAVLADIHGNASALEAVLADAEAQGATDYLVLGDLCYRGPKPKESLELIRKLHAKVIKGNADAWAVRGVKEGEVPDSALQMMQTEQTFTASCLSEEDIQYLDSLPTTLEIPLTNKRQMFAFHATPESIFDVVSQEASNQTFEAWTKENPRAEFLTYGHIHVSHFRHIDGRKIFNPGSIGLPFDGDPRASYVILKREENDINLDFRRVSYDINKAVKDLEESGYPPSAVPLLTHIYMNGARPAAQ